MKFVYLIHRQDARGVHPAEHMCWSKQEVELEISKRLKEWHEKFPSIPHAFFYTLQETN